MVTRSGFTSLVVALTACGVFGWSAEVRSAGTDRERAQQAFYQLEEEPHDRALMETVWLNLQALHASNPGEPWVHIALSRIHLAAAYETGDRFSIRSYATEELESARRHAQEAVTLSPSLSMAMSNLARIQIILSDRKNAWTALRTAHDADRNDFYPWYLRAVLERSKPENATRSLEAAARLATRTYQRRFLLDEHVTLALRERNLVAAEKYLRKIVELEPHRAYSYGNYGWFLANWARRYDDAIVQLEKAVAIKPYPAAVEELKRARLLRDTHN
jgi:Tfp pilus assembly protein PilF